ncbi:MAG: PKD domain-containing protein [archaeon]
MSLRGDDRGVVIQVGAVLLFAFVIMAITMYQVEVVPDQNKEVEFKHNEEVQNQLLDVRSAIMTTAGGGGSRSVAVALGTNYPSRTIFLNPSPPYGTLRTVGTTNESIDVTISNARATNNETADFWDGTTNHSYSTGALVYEPFYHRYQDPPTTVYEHSLLANRFEDAGLAKTDQKLVDDDEITLVVLNGSLEESRTGSVSLDTKELSVSTQTIEVTDESGPITLTVPTLLEESVWNESLAGEENVTIDYRSYPDRRFNVLEVTLDPGTYTLKMAKVGVGSETEAPSRSDDYITGQDTNKSVQTGGTVSLTVEARDRYNNPIEGETVTIESPATPTTAETGSDGKVTFTYEAPDTPTTDRVTAWIDKNASEAEAERVVFTIDVNEPSGGSGGGSGAYTIDWRDPSLDNDDAILSNCSDTSCTWDVGKDGDDRLNLTAALNETVSGITVEFGTNDTTVAYPDPDEDETESSGEAKSDLVAVTNGTVSVFASSGGDSDRIYIAVTNVTDGGTNQPPTADFTWNCTGASCSFDATDSSDSDGSISSYSWDFGDGETGTGETVTHEYGPPGTYTVNLTVTDNDGNTDTETKTVTSGGGIQFGETTTWLSDETDVEQELTSIRNDDVTIVNVKVNNTPGRVSELDESGTDSYDYEVEFWESGLFASRTGYAGTPRGYSLPANISVSSDGSTPILESNKTQYLYLAQFLNSGGQPVTMSGEELTITITYIANGETYTTSETVTVS